MTPTDLLPPPTVDTRAADALAAITRRAAQPENVGVDRAVVRRAARLLRGRT